MYVVNHRDSRPIFILNKKNTFLIVCKLIHYRHNQNKKYMHIPVYIYVCYILHVDSFY